MTTIDIGIGHDNDLVISLRLPIGFVSSFVNARMGAPLRSGPNEGNASAKALSFSEYASPRSLAAVKAP